MCGKGSAEGWGRGPAPTSDRCSSMVTHEPIVNACSGEPPTVSLSIKSTGRTREQPQEAEGKARRACATRACGVVGRRVSPISHYWTWTLPSRHGPAHPSPDPLQSANKPPDDPAPRQHPRQHEEVTGAHDTASRCASIRSRARSERATRPTGYLVSVSPCGTSTLTGSP